MNKLKKYLKGLKSGLKFLCYFSERQIILKYKWQFSLKKKKKKKKKKNIHKSTDILGWVVELLDVQYESDWSKSTKIFNEKAAIEI